MMISRVISPLVTCLPDLVDVLLCVQANTPSSPLKHTTTLFSLSDHYILSWEWRVIANLVHTNYHGGHMALKSVRCDRAVDYEGSSLWSNVL